MKPTPRLITPFLFLAYGALAVLEKPQGPIVFVEKAKTSELFDLLTYPARLIPTKTATVLSDADSIIKEIRAPLGKAVKRGDTLLVLANTDPIYRYAPLIVRAPFTGVISSIDVTEGSRVTKGQRLAVVTDPSQVKIQLEIAAQDLFAIHPGLKGELILPAQEDQANVHVLGISPFVDPATGTATAELALSQRDKKALHVPPGLVGRVTFRVRDHKGFELPEQAIVYRGQNPTLRIIENGKARYTAVTLGATRRGRVEVVKGLQEGSQVVIRSSSFVAEGEEVTVKNLEEPKS